MATRAGCLFERLPEQVLDALLPPLLLTTTTGLRPLAALNFREVSGQAAAIWDSPHNKQRCLALLQRVWHCSLPEHPQNLSATTLFQLYAKWCRVGTIGPSKRVAEIVHHTGRVFALTTSRTHVISGGFDGAVGVWHMPSCSCRHILECRRKVFSIAAFGCHVACGLEG